MYIRRGILVIMHHFLHGHAARRSRAVRRDNAPVQVPLSFRFYISIMFMAGLAPGSLRVMFLFISTRLPERGAGLREVLGFLFVYTDQSGRWSACGAAVKAVYCNGYGVCR